MKTNFQMLKELLAEFNPGRMGILNHSEIRQVEKTLCLDEMDVLQLRNLRDFTVLYFDRISETADDPIATFDKMSAITSVIDNMIWNKGGEV